MKHTKQIMAVCLALLLAVSLLPAGVLANEGTTTGRTVYKDLGANTEIYAVTPPFGNGYPYYGAKWEPRAVWYGRTAQGGQTPSGYGLVNADALAQESVVSFYFNIDESYSLEYWSYLYGKALEDGKHAFLVYLNFNNEGSDCAKYTGGSYDDKLIETFQYLSTMSFPVLMRIGGEMNVWGDAASPAEFIEAYRYVANLARTYAPNVALVFSPNYSSAYKVDMDAFYPGDAYVDWIGTSLYYNRYHHSGDTARDEFYGVGKYGDPMLNIQQTVNLAKLHNKPIIVTEGGSSNKFGDTDNSAWAAERMQKAYAYLPMVYPQIKAIVSSDYGVAWEQTDYTFYNNPTVTAAYRTAISNSSVFVDDIDRQGAYYNKLSNLGYVLGSGTPTYEGTEETYTYNLEGKMLLAAYTYSPDKLTATWTLDGQVIATPTDYPYSCTVDFNALAAGTHTIAVTFSNGASKSYSFQAKTYTATPTNNALYVGGELQTPSIYKINDSNYFKIRDIAALLSGSGKQFEVGFDAATGSITATSGKPYTMTGTELTGGSTTKTQSVIPSGSTIYVNGQTLDLTVYNIDGFNYFKLRDLGEALDFYVGYNPIDGSMTIDGTKGYVK